MNPAQSRLVLAANLKALMASSRVLDTFPKLTAAGTGLSNGTLDRIRRAQGGCSVDQLDRLAKAFDVAAWQLLVPGLTPGRLPELLGGEAERALWTRIDQLSQEIRELRAGRSPGQPVHPIAETPPASVEPGHGATSEPSATIAQPGKSRSTGGETAWDSKTRRTGLRVAAAAETDAPTGEADKANKDAEVAAARARQKSRSSKNARGMKP